MRHKPFIAIGAIVGLSFALVGVSSVFSQSPTDASCPKPLLREVAPFSVPRSAPGGLSNAENPTTFYLMGSNFRPTSEMCPGLNVQEASVRFYTWANASDASPVFTYGFPEGNVTGDDWTDGMFRLWVRHLPSTLVPGKYSVIVTTAGGESGPVAFELTQASQVTPTPTARPTVLPSRTPTPTPTLAISCVPRPVCMTAGTDAQCYIPEPVQGWCDRPCEKAPACVSAQPACTIAPPVGGWCVYESPTACTDIYRPVCATDGRTYPNPCFAAAAGATLLHEGECGACEKVNGVPVCADPGTGYTYDRTLVSGTAWSTIDPCWCGRIVPVRPAGATPTPTPTRAAVVPTPTPFPCTETAGYASSCWADGRDRVLRVALPTSLSSAPGGSGMPVTIVVALPPTVQYNAIWNQAHYWSEGRKSWVPVKLSGKIYPGAVHDAAGRGYLTGSAGASVTVTPQDALNGLVYVVTWDYTYQNNDWVDPPCAAGSPAGSRCWRVMTVPVPPATQ